MTTADEANVKDGDQDDLDNIDDCSDFFSKHHQGRVKRAAIKNSSPTSTSVATSQFPENSSLKQQQLLASQLDPSVLRLNSRKPDLPQVTDFS